MVEDRLRKIIDKYGGNKTDYAIAKRMAEISLEEEEQNYSDRSHRELLTKKINSYKTNLCDYKAGRKKPKLDTILLISAAIGCSQEELSAIFYPPDNVSLFSNDSELPVENGKKLLVRNHEVTEEGVGFKILEVTTKRVYFEDGRLEWSQTLKIQCLQDNQNLQELGFCEYIAESVKDSFISAKFHEPLRKGEQVDLTINYFCNKSVQVNSAFGKTIL